MITKKDIKKYGMYMALLGTTSCLLILITTLWIIGKLDGIAFIVSFIIYILTFLKASTIETETYKKIQCVGVAQWIEQRPSKP